uniref:PRAME family member 10-like n=1 Tax=Callospermophilus lateralis TaxID=76772 RepID=UPI004038A1D0
MSIQSPPMLLELAGNSLLSDKYTSILDLEILLIELFPPLFVEAFSRGHTEFLNKMVQAWPFTHLPLGALMRKPHLEMIQVALDGPDILLAQQDRPRRWKLQVLDLWNIPQNFWRMWSGAMVDACSPEAMKKNQTLKLCPTMAAKMPLKAEDLWETNQPQQECPETAEAELCPEGGSPLHLGALHFGCLCSFFGPDEEPEETCLLGPHACLHFPRGQGVAALPDHLAVPQDGLPSEVRVDAVLLLEGHLKQVLGQLKHMELRDIRQTYFSLEPLKILLDSTTITLENLDFEACGITDFQLQALLPALSHCSQLVILNFHGNHISMSPLRDLMVHTPG